MRTLQVINGEFYSGAERVQDLLALRLPALGWASDFACLKPGRFPDQRRARDAALHRLPMGSRLDLGCGVRLAALVRREGYRLLHTHTPRAAMVGRIASLLAGVPMVHHVHSPTARDTTERWRNHLNRITESWSLTGVPRLIAVSASLRDQLRADGVDAARIRVVPNGVPGPDRLPGRAAPEGTWTLGCIALFRPRKGLEVLLAALARLRAQGRAVRLLAIGPFETADYEAAMHALAAELGIADAIEWAGFTADVDAALRRMDTMVLPSLFGEGMPMVVLEAMAAGVPVVASAVEGTPEVIEDGRSGLLVPPGDAGALAASLGGLLDGRPDWSALRAAAFRRQHEHFSDAAMAAGVARVYAEVLGDA
jgi:glycosyltransferase involved in cell wall biosynthesis